MYSLNRMKQSIIECFCQKNKSWLTRRNLLIQWFEAVDRNFCQQNRLRDSKNEICRWNGFDVSDEKYFVDRMDQRGKNAFSQHKGFSSLTKYISSPDVLAELSIILHVCH